MKQQQFEKSIFLSDLHVPFEQKKSLKVVDSFMSWFKPDKIYLMGDIVDFYAVSSFDKDPERITSLQEDINKAHKILKGIRACNPKADIMYIEGNHEHRLQKYLWKHPEISSLDALSITNLLMLTELKIAYVNQFESFKYHKFLVEHGSVVRQQSAYTARAMLEKRGMSGISGHTHRMGAHYLTNMSGSYAWFENGCLCDLHPEYVVGQPNWMNGFSIGYFRKQGNRFNIEQIPIVDNHASYGEQEF
jgi:UDP-2,3-diacylglucosamine pyrophosphatase LpxH